MPDIIKVRTSTIARMALDGATHSLRRRAHTVALNAASQGLAAIEVRREDFDTFVSGDGETLDVLGFELGEPSDLVPVLLRSVEASDPLK